MQEYKLLQVKYFVYQQDTITVMLQHVSSSLQCHTTLVLTYAFIILDPPMGIMPPPDRAVTISGSTVAVEYVFF